MHTTIFLVQAKNALRLGWAHRAIYGVPAIVGRNTGQRVRIRLCVDG